MGCRPRAQGYICTATRGDAAARVWGWTGGRSAVLPGPLPGASWVSEGEGGPWLELGPPKWTGSWPPGATVWLCPYPEACPFQSRDPRSRTHLSTPGLGPPHAESPGGLAGPLAGLAVPQRHLLAAPVPPARLPRSVASSSPSLPTWAWRGGLRASRGRSQRGPRIVPPPLAGLPSLKPQDPHHCTSAPRLSGPRHCGPWGLACTLHPSWPDPHPCPSPRHRGWVAGAVGPGAAGLGAGERARASAPRTASPLGTRGGSQRDVAWGRGMAVLWAPAQGAGGPDTPRLEVRLHVAHCCAPSGGAPEQWGVHMAPWACGLSGCQQRCQRWPVPRPQCPWRWPRVAVVQHGGRVGARRGPRTPALGTKGAGCWAQARGPAS